MKKKIKEKKKDKKAILLRSICGHHSKCSKRVQSLIFIGEKSFKQNRIKVDVPKNQFVLWYQARKNLHEKKLLHGEKKITAHEQRNGGRVSFFYTFL